MTGSRWLHRYVEQNGKGPHVRKAMEQRIRSKIRNLSPEWARRHLTEFADFEKGSARLHEFSVLMVGGWSPSLDDVIKRELAHRAGILP